MPGKRKKAQEPVRQEKGLDSFVTKTKRAKSEVYPTDSDAIGDENDFQNGYSCDKSLWVSGEKFMGAHFSIKGGVENAILKGVQIGAKAVAMFLKSQRTWASKPLDDATAERFKKICAGNNFPMNMILPHGSYLLNCGSPKEDIWIKSRNGLLEELERCDKLGITLFNFHPGSTCGEISIEKCLQKIADCINYAHSKTKTCITVIENMSKQGNTVGGDFKEIRGIIDLVEDKSRVGVCIDTCHAFAAGYNLATEKGYEKMWSDFDEIIGMKYLKAMHINDSKGKVGCHLDRHENIGKGLIGLPMFKYLMNDPRLNQIPLILETPCPDDSDAIYEGEIKLLNGLLDE